MIPRKRSCQSLRSAVLARSKRPRLSYACCREDPSLEVHRPPNSEPFSDTLALPFDSVLDKLFTSSRGYSTDTGRSTFARGGSRGRGGRGRGGGKRSGGSNAAVAAGSGAQAVPSTTPTPTPPARRRGRGLAKVHPPSSWKRDNNGRMLKMSDAEYDPIKATWDAARAAATTATGATPTVVPPASVPTTVSAPVAQSAPKAPVPQVAQNLSMTVAATATQSTPARDPASGAQSVSARAAPVHSAPATGTTPAAQRVWTTAAAPTVQSLSPQVVAPNAQTVPAKIVAPVGQSLPTAGATPAAQDIAGTVPPTPDQSKRATSAPQPVASIPNITHTPATQLIVATAAATAAAQSVPETVGTPATSVVPQTSSTFRTPLPSSAQGNNPKKRSADHLVDKLSISSFRKKFRVASTSDVSSPGGSNLNQDQVAPASSQAPITTAKGPESRRERQSWQSQNDQTQAAVAIAERGAPANDQTLDDARSILTGGGGFQSQEPDSADQATSTPEVRSDGSTADDVSSFDSVFDERDTRPSRKAAPNKDPQQTPHPVPEVPAATRDTNPQPRHLVLPNYPQPLYSGTQAQTYNVPQTVPKKKPGVIRVKRKPPVKPWTLDEKFAKDTLHPNEMLAPEYARNCAQAAIFLQSLRVRDGANLEKQVRENLDGVIQALFVFQQPDALFGIPELVNFHPLWLADVDNLLRAENPPFGLEDVDIAEFVTMIDTIDPLGELLEFARSNGGVSAFDKDDFLMLHELIQVPEGADESDESDESDEPPDRDWRSDEARVDAARAYHYLERLVQYAVSELGDTPDLDPEERARAQQSAMVDVLNANPTDALRAMSVIQLPSNMAAEAKFDLEWKMNKNHVKHLVESEGVEMTLDSEDIDKLKSLVKFRADANQSPVVRKLSAGNSTEWVGVV